MHSHALTYRYDHQKKSTSFDALTSQASAPFRLQMSLLPDGVERASISHFIQNGYQKAFQANIQVTMPYLLALEDHHAKAALGIRSAHQGFFVQQYLDDSLEESIISIIQQQQPTATENEIIEIGNLYSNAKHLTLPLFLITAVSAYQANKRYFVICATEQLINMFTKSGVHCHQIRLAQQASLAPSSDDWGCYYSTSPSIAYISLAQVMSLIQENKFFTKVVHRLSAQIHSATQVLCQTL